MINPWQLCLRILYHNQSELVKGFKYRAIEQEITACGQSILNLVTIVRISCGGKWILLVRWHVAERVDQFNGQV